MTCTDTRDVVATADQIQKLTDAGCEVVRVAVPDKEAAAAVGEIKSRISIPLIADIHFNYTLALLAIRNGADCVRINPGNIGRDRMPEIIQAVRERGISMRIGVNAGSLEKDLLEKYGGPTSQALVESALRSIEYCEDRGFTNFKLSLKSSNVSTMIDAYRAVSTHTDYPLHLGVTEAGTLVNSTIKSSIGIGTLLYDGIGDTIRVSITGDPVSEVSVAYGILRTLDIRKVGPDIIACPTCGRCEIDLFTLAEEVERRLAGMKAYCKVAIMGCVVNGPGEAAEADVGIAGGRQQGLLFRRGEVVRKIREDEFVDALVDEINAVTGNK
jgi:(E)-4-hydroxy-3-methylbut-2-enyl-diphosphate synthase